MKNNVTHVIANESVSCFDVDWTLIEPCQSDDVGAIKMIDPRTNKEVYFIPYKEHMTLMEEMKGRGRYIIVWSAAGYAWAKAIVEALKLTPYVDQIMTKPLCMVDDKPITDWTTRVFLPKIAK